MTCHAVIPRCRHIATKILDVAHPPANRLAQRFADALDRDPVEHLLEEAGDDHPHRFAARVAAGHRVEHLLLVDAAARAAVRAADVVGFDLQAGIESARASRESIRLSFRW